MAPHFNITTECEAYTLCKGFRRVLTCVEAWQWKNTKAYSTEAKFGNADLAEERNEFYVLNRERITWQKNEKISKNFLHLNSHRSMSEYKKMQFFHIIENVRKIFFIGNWYDVQSKSLNNISISFSSLIGCANLAHCSYHTHMVMRLHIHTE